MSTGAKWLERIIFGGLLLTPFVPLIVANSLFFPYITGKAFAFRILIEVLFALYLIAALGNPALRLRWRLSEGRRDYLLILAAAFLLVLILATIFGVDAYRSFWSNYERMDGLISYLHLAAYFWLLVAVLRSESAWRWFWHFSVGVSVIVVVMAIAEFGRLAGTSTSAVRLAGAFGNPIYLAVYMLVQAFVTAWLALRSRLRSQQLVYGLIIVGQLWTLYHTATRSALLGLAAGVLVAVAALAIFGRQYRRARRLAAVALLVLLALGGGLWFGRDSRLVQSQPVLARLTNISLQDATTRHRLLNWGMAGKGFRERPLLGWGPENYPTVFNQYYNPRLYDAEQWFDRTHNIFLDWLVSAGFLGLLGYLSLFAVAFWYLWRRSSVFDLTERCLFTGLFVAYLFHNLFVFDNLTSYLLFFALLGYLHFRATGGDLSTTAPASAGAGANPTVSSRRQLLFAAGVVLLLMVGLYSLNFQPLRANRLLLRALASQSTLERLGWFEKVAAYRTFGTIEMGEQLLSDASSIVRASEVPAVLKSQVVTAVKKELDAQLAETPDHLRLQLFYGAFLRAAGEPAAALPHLEKARALSPTKQTILFELVFTYNQLNDKAKALAAAKTAYELLPEFIEAKRIYALALAQAGERAEAEKLLQELNAATPEAGVTDAEINTYAAAGRYDKVLELWQKRVAQKPDDPQYRFSLAAAYLYNDRRAEAVAELREALRLEPRLKEQAEKLIAEIESGGNPLKK